MGCRSNNLCPLGQLGCNSVQISGQSANCVERVHNTGQKCANPPQIQPNLYDVMVIGGEPSVEDDQSNMIWSDNSGIQIINYLKKAGHDLDRVYMTRIVKCKPNIRGRKPSVSEINICRDNHLRKEIELIQPKVAILVGSSALKAFNLTGKGSLNAIHGRVFEARFAKSKGMSATEYEAQPVYKVIPTINPSTFFYNPNKKLQARIGYDYVVAKQVLEGKKPTKHFVPDYHLIDSIEKLEWLEEKLLSSTMFGWDTEFPKLGFRKVPVICFQFAWGWESDQCAVLPIRQHDPNAPKEQEFHVKPFFGMKNDDLVTKFMKKVFLTPNIIKTGHNQKGDLHILRWNYGVVPQGFLFDTLIAKHLMDENPPSDLEFLCDLEFSWGDYEEPRRAITGSGKKLKATFDKVPDEIFWPYGATDALGSYRLGVLYIQKLQNKPNLWKFFLEESEKLQRPLAKAEYKGALIHQEVMNILEEQFEKEQKKLLTELRRITSKPDFNPKSPKQILPALLSMGVTNVDLEDNKNSSGISTGKTKLLDIVAKGIEPAASFAAAISKYRNRSKMIDTYIKNCKKDLDSDGRIRYPWKITGTKTGRLSCEFFHQISKIDEKIIFYGENNFYVPFEKRLKDKRIVMRDLITAALGYKIVYGDFSQIELRIVAIVSNDQEMLLILSTPDGDLHTATAYEFVRTQWPGMLECDVNKFNRDHVGKPVNFGFIYGSEGYQLIRTGKFQDKNGVEKNFTWSFLNKGMATWKKRFKGVGKFIDMTPDMVRANGNMAVSVFGRERHFGNELNSSKDYERKHAERQAINDLIQSPAGSILNRTIIAVDDMLENFNIRENTVCPINCVHDSVMYEVKNSHVEWFENALRIISQRKYPELNNSSFKMNIGIGQTWAEAEINAK